VNGSEPLRCVLIGAGRVGSALAQALQSVGWHVDLIRARPLLGAQAGAAVERLRLLVETADLVLLTVTDTALESVAAIVPPIDGVIAHVSGGTTLDPLAPHRRVASIHPLMSLPDIDVGVQRLLDNGTFAIDGDAFIAQVVDSLGGTSIQVPADKRAAYHAAAAVAANHVVALCGQIERLAGQISIPVDAYWTMMREAVDNVADRGAAAALTGPASRGDWETVRRHVAALSDDDERQLYLACCSAAARLADQQIPPDLAGD